MRDLQIEGLPCKLVKPVRLLMKETDVSISTPKDARERAPPKRGQVAWGMRAKGLSSTSTQFGARATVPVTVTRNSDCDFAATESVAYQLAASFHPLMSPINIFWAVIAIRNFTYLSGIAYPGTANDRTIRDGCARDAYDQTSVIPPS